MVSTSRVPTFSRRYQQWYHDAIRSYQSYTPPVVAHVTCPRDGQVSSSDDISYGRSLFLDITIEPIDFQGLDSRFSRAPIRTTLTGMPDYYYYYYFLFENLNRIPTNLSFDLDLAYEYDHAELGLSISHPRVSSVYTQPPTELPTSATTERDQDDISRPSSPSPFPFPTPGGPFPQICLL
jgi:hypothetical protein